MSENKPSEWAMQLAAQSWCDASTAAIPMNVAISKVFAGILDKQRLELFHAECCAAELRSFIKLHGPFDEELRAKREHALSRDCGKGLIKALEVNATDRPFPLLDVLNDAALIIDHLQHYHDCDCHGYEHHTEIQRKLYEHRDRIKKLIAGATV